MSLDSVHQALLHFWEQFTAQDKDGNTIKVPAYLTGHVPLDANGNPVAFPYFTFNVERGEPLTTDFLTATCWHRAESGLNVNKQRSRVLMEVAKVLPPEGVRLELNWGGYLILRQNGASFQSYVDDPNDDSVIGGRTSYMVQFFDFEEDISKDEQDIMDLIDEGGELVPRT